MFLFVKTVSETNETLKRKKGRKQARKKERKTQILDQVNTKSKNQRILVNQVAFT